jgi:hypothetical protein
MKQDLQDEAAKPIAQMHSAEEKGPLFEMDSLQCSSSSFRLAAFRELTILKGTIEE